MHGKFESDGFETQNQNPIEADFSWLHHILTKEVYTQPYALRMTILVFLGVLHETVQFSVTCESAD